VIRGVLDAATTMLAAAGVGSPRVDAELLLAHVLGVERSALRTIDDLDDGARDRYAALIAHRVAREPLQYLTGEAPFRFAMLAVGPGVFIPRPETELLVDAVLPVLRAQAAPIAVDLCAGSGALAVSVAQEVLAAQVIAVEISPAALPWLRRNADRERVQVVEADIAAPGLPDELFELFGRVDAVLSNPPYVPSGTEVSAEVTHDPSQAVFAGPDGLDLMAPVIALAGALLRSGGLLALEHDDTHGESVPALLRSSGQWVDVADHHDLTGRPRYATAVRR
jgi:release factor glutamine methyltransferase